MATLAAAGVTVESPRENPKTIAPDVPLTRPCRCVSARGKHDPRIWASRADRCERCGRWLPWTIGTEYEDFDLEGLAQLHLDVLEEASRLRGEFAESGEEDYERWLRGRIARTDHDLTRLKRAAR